MDMMNKDTEIINRLKKMCREKTREIHRIYHGGFSSREQCNFDTGRGGDEEVEHRNSSGVWI